VFLRLVQYVLRGDFSLEGKACFCFIVPSANLTGTEPKDSPANGDEDRDWLNSLLSCPLRADSNHPRNFPSNTFYVMRALGASRKARRHLFMQYVLVTVMQIMYKTVNESIHPHFTRYR
jgi:hypothetical protein